MGLPQLESCCFVLDLKTGNIVLGCINAFFSFVLTVTMIVITTTVGSLEDSEIRYLDINEEAAMTGLYVMSIILVLMFLAKFIFDLIFVYGVVMERASIIRAYFVMWIVFFLLSMFTFFLNAPGYSAGTICMEVFYICLNVYAILLSNSFYQLLNKRVEVEPIQGL